MERRYGTEVSAGINQSINLPYPFSLQYDCVKAGDDWEEMVVQKRQIESSKQNQTKRSIP